MGGRKVGQHHGDLRRALLDAALALVGEGALERLSLRGVARRAGVSPGAPYHHFADKAALLAAVAEEGFRALAALQQTHTEPVPGDRLEAMSADYVRFAVAHATHYRVMFARSPGQVDPAEGGALRGTALQTFGMLVEAVAAANPALDADEARRRAVVGWSLAHGAVGVAPWVGELDPSFDVEDLARRVGRAIRGIAEAP